MNEGRVTSRANNLGAEWPRDGEILLNAYVMQADCALVALNKNWDRRR